MKKLLPFLFIISFACYGQAGFLPDTPYKDSKKNSLLFGLYKCRGCEEIKYFPAQDTTLPSPPIYLLSLEEKLLLYAQECWNDSTKQISNSHYVYGEELTWDEAKEIGSFIISKDDKYYAFKYIHRKPTFEGFLEWLRKQK